MRVIDGGLLAPYVVEARRHAFQNFVQGQANAGYPGTCGKAVALYNFGHADSFGPVTYERGLSNGRWIMPDNADNANVLLFTDMRACRAYGNTLVPILKDCGYLGSHFVVQAVVVHTTIPNPLFGSLRPQDRYEGTYYVLRFIIQR